MRDLWLWQVRAPESAKDPPIPFLSRRNASIFDTWCGERNHGGRAARWDGRIYAEAEAV